MTSFFERLFSRARTFLVLILALELMIFSMSHWFSSLCLSIQSESTLWRLKFFVKSALEVQAKSAAVKGNDNKRKREICDALAKTAKKRSKKLSA